MRRIIPILLIIAVSVGFRLFKPTETEKLVKRTGGQPDIAMVRDTDSKMNDAMNTARKTVGEVTSAMQNPKPNQRFTVKMKVSDGNATEYMWLSNLTYDGQMFHGNLSDAPYGVKGYKMGQSMTVAPSEIADWIIRDGDKERGAYTEKVLREKGM